MADTKISALTDGTTANSTDDIPVNRGGANRRITPAYLGTYLAKNTLAGGTITTSQPMTLTQTWNAGGVVFDTFVVNVTNTASASDSTLMNLQIAGVAKLRLQMVSGTTPKLNFGGNDNTGTLSQQQLNLTNGSDSNYRVSVSNTGLHLNSASGVTWTSSNNNAVLGGTQDLGLNRPSAGNLSVNGAAQGDGLGNIIVGALRINATPTANSSAATTITNGADSSSNCGHRISVNMNGTTYWIPCSATAF